MKLLVLFLAIGSAAFASPRTTVDETFKTTFSDYGHFDQMIRCSPGYRGGYATGDTLRLKSHAIELGFDISNQEFQATSMEALMKEPRRVNPSLRPYSAGCGPALEAIRKAVHASDRMEVTVHRKVTVYGDTRSRVDRTVSGEVKSVQYLQNELYYESFSVEIAGFEFHLGQVLNGISRSL